MPSDTYILTISEAGVSVPSNHASSHISGGTDVIPTATTTASGLMSAAIYNQHVINTAKVENKTHTGDVTDLNGALTVNKIKGVDLSSFSNNSVLKVTTGGVIAAATAADYPTLNQSTNGNALTATTATKATNVAGGATGSLPYQTANGSTQMLSAGTSGTVLKSNGAAAPSWSVVEKSMLSTALAGEITDNTSKIGNITHSGDVTDTGGVLKVTKINNVQLSTLGTGILKNTTGTGVPSIAVAADFPTMTAPVGGTGITSYSTGDLLYANSSTTLDKLTSIAAGNVLTTNGTNNAPSYGKVALSGAVTHITGTLPVSSGGTGATSLTGYVIGSGTTGLTASPTIPTSNISGTLSVAQGGTNTTTSTGSGSVVLSTSPTLVTPALGTPSSGNLSSCTNLSLISGVSGTLPVSSGGTGATSLTGYIKGSGTNNFTASPTVPASEISGTLPVAQGGTGATSTTGSGNNVLSTSPTFVTPALGTPSSGNLSNCSGLPLATGVSGTLPVSNGGTGATATTGTGSNVLSNSPTLVTPALGTPSSGNLSSCTGLSLASGVSGTLPVGNGGTGNSSLTGYIRGNGTGAMTAVSAIPITDLSGSFSVSNGGTGQSSFTAGILNTIGGSNSLTTITQPDGDLVGTTAVQTLTNKALTAPALGTPTSGTLTNCTGLPLGTGTTGTLPASRITDLPTGGATVPATAGYVKSNGTALTSVTTIPVADIGGVLPVTSGGTGLSSISDGAMLFGMDGQLSEVVPFNAGFPLIASGAGLSPAFAPLNLSTVGTVAGTLAASHGGTGYQQRACGQFYSTSILSSIALNTQNQNVLVPLSSNVSSSLLDNFSLNTSTGSLVYGNFATRRFCISFTCSFTLTAAANVAFHIAVGASPDAASRSVVTGSGTSIQSLSTQCLMELPANSQIRVYATQTTALATVALVVQSMNLSVIPA
jgi:hypothetical protein